MSLNRDLASAGGKNTVCGIFTCCMPFLGYLLRCGTMEQHAAATDCLLMEYE